MRILGILSLIGVLAIGAFAQSKLSKSEMAEQRALSLLEQKQQVAKVQFQKHPSAQAKTKYVGLTDKLANDTMMAGSLDPKLKYPKALRLYREALKADPHDKEAAKWVKEIEDIYKSMHRPIPH